MKVAALPEHLAFIRDILRPPIKESVVKWVEGNVTLPTGAIRGRVSLRMTPYLREPLERFGDRLTKHLILCFGSQAAKTTLIILGMLYRLVKDPQDAMWVMPNRELAHSFSKARWMKFIEECEPAQALVRKTSKGEVDRHLHSFMEQHFVTMFLKFVGSNSPANLSSFPCGMIVMDETDKYGEQSKYEAAALDLAEERTKTFPFPLIVKASTPTVEGRVIWPEFMKTDQRYYWVTCPRCSKRITLGFSVKTETHGLCGLRWWDQDETESKTDGEWDLAKIRENAHYKCQECGRKILDYERPAMLETGEWRPSNPLAEPGRFGYHLSSLYSILSQKTSLASIAAQWILSKSLLSARQNFINSWLAETWDGAKAFDQSDIQIEEYDPTIASDGSTAILTIDVQENHFWAVARRWAPPSKGKPNGESWLLAADRFETVEDLEKLQKDNGIAGENVILDMAFRPNQVARLIIEKNWRGAWGTDTKSFWWQLGDGRRIERIYSTVQVRDPHMGTAMQDRTMQRARYFKFCKSSGLDILSSLRYADPAIWHVSANVSDRYQRQMNARMKVMIQNKRTGRYVPLWKDLYKEAHLQDCEVMQAIRAIQLGLISVPDEKMEISI
jgi:DNA-directed RNA polymerase subunit RPC12/RpoP